jgi:uncharacterized membrane protein
VYSTKRDPLGGGCRFIIRPNRSLSWRELLVFFYISLSVSFLIALFFLLLGAWLILPFTGFEMLLLFLGLYYVAKRRSRDCEWVTIREDGIETILFTGRKKTATSFPRNWARLELQEDEKWYTSRLLLGAHGKYTEIGAQLSAEEKRELYRDLSRALKQ